MLSLYFWLPNHNIPSWIFIPWIQDYSFQVYFTYVPQISKAKLNFFYPPNFPVITCFFFCLFFCFFLVIMVQTLTTLKTKKSSFIHSFMDSLICLWSSSTFYHCMHNGEQRGHNPCPHGIFCTILSMLSAKT